MASINDNDPRKIILKSLRDDKLSHAYLFLGPETPQKRNLLFELSRLVLCENAVENAALCETCIHCKKSENLSHPDFFVIEPDGVFIKIEQIRNLQEQIIFPPLEAKRRICLILRAKDLHESAANALLKTLEEPPGNTHIFLSAPSARALLPTIVSRCQIVNIPPEELFGSEFEKDSISGLIFSQDPYLKSRIETEDIERLRKSLIAFLVSSEKELAFFEIEELAASSRESFRALLLIFTTIVRDLYLLINKNQAEQGEKTSKTLLNDRYFQEIGKLARSLNCDTLRSFEERLKECDLMLKRNVKIDMLADRLLIFWIKSQRDHE